jgi:nitrite reductase (NO-forming)
MQRKHNRFFTYVAGTATVAIAAAMIAIGAPAASAATRTINVGGVITAFTPKTINVTAGESVSICLKSNDTDHDLTISSLGFKVASKAGGPAVCKTLVAPAAAGSHKFICSLPGHEQAGMVGSLVVKAAGAPAPGGAPAPQQAPGAPAPQQAPGAPQADAPAGGVQTGGGSTAGVTNVNLLTLGGGLLFAAMMTALLGCRVARRD